MRWARPLTVVLALLQGGVVFSLAWQRYATCHNETFDLALYARSAWGLARGDFWNPIADSSFVHLHAAWVLFPLGLIGRVFGTVPVLLVTQATAIAACVWPLARIGERHLGRVGAPLAALLWLAYPNLGHVGSYEMHPGTLALFPLCWVLDALDSHDPRALLWSSLGVLACRADYALLTFVAAVLFARSAHGDGRSDAQRWGVAVAGGSVLYLAVILGLQRVTMSHGPTSAMLHFGDWGGSPLGIVGALISDPSRVWGHLAASERLTYLPRILGPLALLPLLSPRLLWIAAPTIALNLISHWPSATQLDSHYLTPAVPTLVVAAMLGLRRLRAGGPSRFLTAMACAVPMFASLVAGGWPWSRDFVSAAFTFDARSAACAQIASAIPSSASAQGPDALLPHLAERKVVRRGPPPETGTNYVVLDTSIRQRFEHQESLLRTVEEPVLRTWLARSDHGVSSVTASLLLLQKGRPTRGDWSARYFMDATDAHVTNAPVTNAHATDVQPLRLTACLSVLRASVVDQQLELTLRAHEACGPDLALRLGATSRPKRVDLLFDGALSPAHLRSGDTLRSVHALTRTEAAAIRSQGLWLGVLRSSGARPDPHDPIAAPITVAAEH